LNQITNIDVKDELKHKNNCRDREGCFYRRLDDLDQDRKDDKSNHDRANQNPNTHDAIPKLKPQIQV
jgi:hypothetical protein